jgi:hypothetical protein
VPRVNDQAARATTPHHRRARQTSRDVLMALALCKPTHSATVVDTQAVAEVLPENMTSGPVIGDNRLPAIGKHFDVWASNGSRIQF